MRFFDRFKSKFERAIRERRAGSSQEPRRVSDTTAEDRPVRRADSEAPAPLVQTSAGAVESLAHRVLVRPVVTEKTAHLAERGKYVFAVSTDASKPEVRRAVREAYGVDPVAVNMIKMRGKQVRFGQRSGKRKDWCKAIVTVPKGKTLPIYE